MNWIIVLAAIGAAFAQTSEQADPAAQTDGVMNDAEWSAGKTIATGEGATLLARVEDDLLCLGVRSDELGILTFWVSEGDTVRLWHASAAIGEAVYRRGDEGAYRLTENWGEWNRDNDAESRRAFFDANGWVASITPDPESREREFAVDLSRLRGDARIAVSFGAGEQFDDVLVWPMELDDDVLLGVMQRGDLPDAARFKPEEWSAAGMFRVGG